jgi:hypothetical protein
VASDACDQIRNLIHRYSEAVDLGRFEVLDELFAEARVRTAMGSGPPGPGIDGRSVGALFGGGIVLYADGTPRTRHLVTNTIIDVDEPAGRATARSYNTTLQQVPGRGIEIIATARYEDTFLLAGGRWRFSERVIRHSSLDGVDRDFIGDMSRHTRSVPLEPQALPAPGQGVGGLWHTGPDRADHANSATIRPARRLTIEATVDLASRASARLPGWLPLARQLEHSGYGHGSGDLGWYPSSSCCHDSTGQPPGGCTLNILPPIW